MFERFLQCFITDRDRVLDEVAISQLLDVSANVFLTISRISESDNTDFDVFCSQVKRIDSILLSQIVSKAEEHVD